MPDFFRVDSIGEDIRFLYLMWSQKPSFETLTHLVLHSEYEINMPN